MVKPRAVANSKGELREYPTFPDQKMLGSAKMMDTKQPLLIAGGLACVTGEIPRVVDFETGMNNNRILRDGVWQSDPLLMDERALVFNLKGKGLVVVSGCAHAGIINTIRYAQQDNWCLQSLRGVRRLPPLRQRVRETNPSNS